MSGYFAEPEPPHDEGLPGQIENPKTEEEIVHNAQIDADRVGVPMVASLYRGEWMYESLAQFEELEAWGMPYEKRVIVHPHTGALPCES